VTSRPDIAAAIRERLNSPRPLVTRPDPAVLGAELLRQLLPAPAGRSLRPSALGHCARQIAYSLAGAEAEERDESGMRAQAAVGDAVELLVVAALADVLATFDAPALAGWRLEGARSAGAQMRSTGELRVEDLRVDLSGSTDGMLIGPGTKAVLEVKCVSAVEDVRIGVALARGTDPWHRGHRHYWQNEAYMLGLGVGASAVVTVCRDSGRIQSWWRERDGAYEGAVREHLGRVLASYDPDDVSRMLPDGSPVEPVVDLHKKTGRPNKAHGALPTCCALCDFARRCWGPELSETWDSGKRVLRLGRPGPPLPPVDAYEEALP
jgi:hypothetical protein